MINLVLGFFSLLLIFFQLAYPSWLSFFLIRPDFGIIIIIFLSLYSKAKRTFFWAVVLGGLKDFLTADWFGIHILSFSLVSVLVDNLSVRFLWREKFNALFLFTFGVTLVNNLLVHILHNLFGVAQYPFSSLLRILIFSPLLTALWCLPVIYLLKKCALESYITRS